MKLASENEEWWDYIKSLRELIELLRPEHDRYVELMRLDYERELTLEEELEKASLSRHYLAFTDLQHGERGL